MIYEIMRTDAGVTFPLKALSPAGKQRVKAMGENTVDMQFELPVYVGFKIRDFVVIDGERYNINQTPTYEKLAKRKHQYNIQFEHEFYDFSKVQLKSLNPTNGYLEPNFNLMATAEIIIDLIVTNINRDYPGWSVGVVDATAFKLYSFSGQNCLQVLYQLAADNETELWVENKVIHLQKREQSSGLTFAQGQGNGLYNIRRQNKSNTNIITRLIVRGSSENLPIGYRDYAGSLLLPGGIPYIQDNAKVAMYGVIEHTLSLDIKPEREGSVTSVVAGAGNWKYFTDNTLDFDLNGVMLAGSAIVFNTGQLAGYKFIIADYNHATKTFTISKNEDEKDLDIPSDLFRAAVGDKYSVVNIQMPQPLVDDAETRLLAAGQSYYDKNSDPDFLLSYSANCDSLFIKQNNVQVVLGNTAIIFDADMGLNTEVRIASYVRDLQDRDLYDEVEWSDTIGGNEIVRQYAQQQRTLQLIQNSGLLDVNQVRKNIFLNRLSELDGYLLLAGVKVRAGVADYAIDAAHASISDYASDSDKWDGRQFADYLDQPLRKADGVKFASVVADTVNSTTYVSGFTGSGYKINPDGSAEFDSLTVRKDLNINVLNVREITGSGGSLAITNVAKIFAVVDGGAYWRCEINTDDNTIAVQLRANDVIRCQIWDGKKLKYYSAIVTSVGADYFNLSKATKVGGGIPEAGDTVFQFGNTADANRQGLIYLTNSDNGAPYLDVLDGITSDSLAGKTKVRLGKLNGIVDPDFGALDGYGFYGQNVFVKGKIMVTGGNAATINNVANAKSEAITTATTQAQADATAKASAAQVVAIQTAANDASNKVAALQIGTRNLAVNGEMQRVGLRYLGFNIPIIAGQEYIWSVDVKISQILAPGEAIKMYFLDGITGSFGDSNIDATTEYKRFFITGVVPNWYAGNNNTLSLYSTINPNITIYAKNYSLKKGGKDSDWTPAPEDVYSSVVAAQVAAQTYATAQSAYEREIAKAYADGIVDLEEAARIAQAATNLQNAKDDATNKVNVAYASANGYTDTKSLSTLSAAQSYADNSATSKANVAQANAISQASTDAQNKANAAQSAAALLSQQLVEGVKVGGRNLFFNSSTQITFQNSLQKPIVLVIGEEYTWSLDLKADRNTSARIYFLDNVTGSFAFLDTAIIPEFKRYKYSGTCPVWWSVATGTLFITSDDNSALFTIKNVKIEKGNKDTDWTPAPEDVQAAIDLAKSTADAAKANYTALTANLKSLAYLDVVELAKLGSTVIEGGKIKTTLLDADYIRANMVNAGYINTLELDAVAIKSGTIDSARINAAQIISNGGGATVNFVNTSISTATTQAQADATAKASAAQVAAIQSAANDATTKVNLLQTTSAADAQAKANAAQQSAQVYADAQAAYEREIAKAYADGIVDLEEAARIAQAATNLQNAKDDATNKVNVAYASANGYTDTKSLSTLSAAQSYADNSATSKANIAQANAISQASTDAQNKANAAQSAAALLSQQLVEGVTVGGRNLLFNSGTQITFQNNLQKPILLVIGEEYTWSLDLKADRNTSARIYFLDNVTGSFAMLDTAISPEFKRCKYSGTCPVWWSVSTGFLFIISNDNSALFTIKNVKIEQGNKATDWTPAPEDVQTAIDNVKALANTANANYTALTANLRSLAYLDVVELAKLGSTIIEGGKIKTTLLDADYIRANVINAGYITALDLTVKNLKTSPNGKRVEILGNANSLSFYDGFVRSIKIDSSEYGTSVIAYLNDVPMSRMTTAGFQTESEFRAVDASLPDKYSLMTKDLVKTTSVETKKIVVTEETILQVPNLKLFNGTTYYQVILGIDELGNNVLRYQVV